MGYHGAARGRLHRKACGGRAAECRDVPLHLSLSMTGEAECGGNQSEAFSDFLFSENDDFTSRFR